MKHIRKVGLTECSVGPLSNKSDSNKLPRQEDYFIRGFRRAVGLTYTYSVELNEDVLNLCEVALSKVKIIYYFCLGTLWINENGEMKPTNLTII